MRSSVGFPLGKRETSPDRVGGKAVTTVPLSGGSAGPVGSLRKGGRRGGCSLGWNESVFQSQDGCKGRAPRELPWEEACPQQRPQQCPLLLGKDRTEQGEGWRAQLGAVELPSAREACLRGVHPPCTFRCFLGFSRLALHPSLRWKTGRSRHLSGIECA